MYNHYNHYNHKQRAFALCKPAVEAPYTKVLPWSEYRKLHHIRRRVPTPRQYELYYSYCLAHECVAEHYKFLTSAYYTQYWSQLDI